MSDAFVSTLIEAIENTKSMLPEHWSTLVGERKAGSKWGEEISEETIRGLEWRAITVAPEVSSPGCIYFMAPIIGVLPGATIGAVSLSACRKAGVSVTIVDGAHGQELRANVRNPSVEQASIATLIVGPHEGSPVVYTVHPGMPLAPLPKDFDGEIGALPGQTAVKVS